MKTSLSNATYVLPRWLRGWEQFWFTPADPAVLAAMRITCGLVVLYTFFAYSFKLQEFMGENAWNNLQYRLDVVRDRPVNANPLDGVEYARPPQPVNEFQIEYHDTYLKKWGFLPPPPYPKNREEADKLDEFQVATGYDLRRYGLPIPRDEKEWDYARRYTKAWGLPPPAYPKTAEEDAAIEEYMRREGADPRKIYARGMRAFSLFFHVTDPDAMAVIHGLIVLSAFLFTIGFCTRLTSAFTWFGSLCYIHRNPTVLFGVDTMMTVLLLYLMISPCGAYLSADRAIRRWWSQAKPGVIQGWFRFWNKPVPDAADIAPAPFSEIPAPSICANVAIRCLQIHVCIIYLASGLSKLLGPAWWNGTAIWGTIANYEFAPMQFEIYISFLRFLGNHPFLSDVFMTCGGLFTLTFEIGYVFLIWRPKLRWFYLSAAIILHAGIGLFMGLKTFSLLMLVLNMAFLRPEEIYWVLGWLGLAPGSADTATTRLPDPKPALATAIAGGAAGMKTK